MPLIEAAATDERNFVKKGVNWALRAIGGKKSPALRSAARKLATKLAGSTDKTARWIGKDALKAFDKADAGAGAKESPQTATGSAQETRNPSAEPLSARPVRARAKPPAPSGRRAS